MANSQETYYPSNVKLDVLENKIYLLTWEQHGKSRQKLLTKAMCLRDANNTNVASQLREVIVDGFKAGDIK